MLLNQFVDVFECYFDELIVLCICEVGKVIQDLVDEICEVVDFCCYYVVCVVELGQDECLVLWGVVLCISFWNFLLVIFFGQVVVVLVIGNIVVVKFVE